MRVIFDPTQCKLKPNDHQIVDAQSLIDHPEFALFSEMGTGKSATVIYAACTLAQAGKIDTVIVVCPASVRSVWQDPDMGEVHKHSFVNSQVHEFHAHTKLKWCNEGPAKLVWLITNFEILRGENHLKKLIDLIKGCKVLLVLDESTFIKSRTAKQTRAIMKLREHCARCIILSGTPVFHSPLDLFSQMNALKPGWAPNFWAFRAKYCEMVPQRFGRGPVFQKIVKYVNLDDLSKRIAPHCVRRLKADCLSLPPKLYTVREVALSKESWARYVTLRKEAVIALGDGELRLEPNAATRILRLCQLTSGHLGGGTIGSGLPEIEGEMAVQQDLSSEKLSWCVDYLTNECTARYVIAWCRWRRERERLVAALNALHPKAPEGIAKYSHTVNMAEQILPYEIYGGQPKAEREQAVFTFSGACEPICKRYVCVAQPRAGGLGLNLVAATEVIYLSNDWSYGMRLQSEDRCHRPGQRHPVTYIDVLATGPSGAKTVDHAVLGALRDKADLAHWTTAMWRKALDEEKA